MKKVFLLLISAFIMTSFNPLLKYYNIKARLDYNFFVNKNDIQGLKDFVGKYPVSPKAGFVKLDIDLFVKKHNKQYLSQETKIHKIFVYINYKNGKKTNYIAGDILYQNFVDALRPFIDKTNLELFRQDSLPFYLSQGDMFIYLSFEQHKKTVNLTTHIFFPKLSYNNSPYYNEQFRLKSDNKNYGDLLSQLQKNIFWFKLKTMLYMLSGRFETILPDVLLDFSDFDFTRFVVESGNPWLIDAIIRTGDEDLISYTLFKYVNRIKVRQSIFYYAYRWDGMKFLLSKPYLILTFSSKEKRRIIPVFLKAIEQDANPHLFSDVLYYLLETNATAVEKNELRQIYRRYKNFKSAEFRLQNIIILDIISRAK